MIGSMRTEDADALNVCVELIGKLLDEILDHSDAGLGRVSHTHTHTNYHGTSTLLTAHP